MSIFKANKKYLGIAQTAMSNAYNVQMEQRDVDFGRQLLSNIRQYRIEQASLQEAEASVGEAHVSGIQTGKQYLQQQFNEPYSRTMADADRQEEIKKYESQAQAALSRFKKQAKTAKTAGYIAALATGGTSSVLLGLAGGADRNYYGGTIQGSTTAAQIALTVVGTIFGGPAGGAAGAAIGGAIKSAAGGIADRQSYTLPDGGAAMTEATPGGSSDISWSGVASAAYSIFDRLGKDMQYLSQDPQLSVQLRGFA